MKYLIFLLAIATISSCTTTPELKPPKPAPGFLNTADGKIDAVDADPANLAIIEKYIKAHNDRNLDVIAEMDHDSISIERPDGVVVLGKGAHRDSLSSWFNSSNPKWNTVFAYSMKVVGQNGEWVIAGNSFSDEVNGVEIKEYHIGDFFLVDKKVRRIIITKKKI